MLIWLQAWNGFWLSGACLGAVGVWLPSNPFSPGNPSLACPWYPQRIAMWGRGKKRRGCIYVCGVWWWWWEEKNIFPHPLPAHCCVTGEKVKRRHAQAGEGNSEGGGIFVQCLRGPKDGNWLSGPCLPGEGDSLPATSHPGGPSQECRVPIIIKEDLTT